jgi:hypothetical protein
VHEDYIDTISVKSSSKNNSKNAASGNLTGRASGSSDLKDILSRDLGAGAHSHRQRGGHHSRVNSNNLATAPRERAGTKQFLGPGSNQPGQNEESKHPALKHLGALGESSAFVKIDQELRNNQLVKPQTNRRMTFDVAEFKSSALKMGALQPDTGNLIQQQLSGLDAKRKFEEN